MKDQTQMVPMPQADVHPRFPLKQEVSPHSQLGAHHATPSKCRLGQGPYTTSYSKQPRDQMSDSEVIAALKGSSLVTCSNASPLKHSKVDRQGAHAALGSGVGAVWWEEGLTSASLGSWAAPCSPSCPPDK